MYRSVPKNSKDSKNHCGPITLLHHSRCEKSLFYEPRNSRQEIHNAEERCRIDSGRIQGFAILRGTEKAGSIFGLHMKPKKEKNRSS